MRRLLKLLLVVLCGSSSNLFGEHALINTSRFSDGNKYFIMFVARGRYHAYVIYCTEVNTLKLSSCHGYGLYPDSSIDRSAKIVQALGVFPGDVENEAKLAALTDPTSPGVWGD